MSFRNDSPRWTDWGWPPRTLPDCPGCDATIGYTYGDRGQQLYVAHPHPTNPRALCAASEQPTDGSVDWATLGGDGA